MSNIYSFQPISNKYDSSLDYNITMYDNLPYKRNAELCGAKQLGLYSGHIVKYYLCINHNDAYKVNNHDDNIREILAKAKAKQEKISIKQKEQALNDTTDNRITPEQIQTLLDDRQEVVNPESFDISDVDAPEATPNAFAGIEDW